MRKLSNHHTQHSVLVMKDASGKLYVDTICKKLQELERGDALNIILEKRTVEEILLDCLD